MEKKHLEKFNIFYKEHIDAIYNYIYYRTGRNRSLAEDITAEVFLKAAEKFHTFDPEKGTLKSWIYRIAHNHLVNYYRDSVTELSLDELLDQSDNSTPANELAVQQEERDMILGILDKLPTEARTIVHLRYYEEYSYDEIAKIVEKTPGALRVQIHRLLEYLYNEFPNNT